jgi:hypothetical protein
MAQVTATLDGRPIKIGNHYRVHGQPGRYGHWSVPITYTDTGEHIVMPRGQFYKAMRREQRRGKSEAGT